MRRSVFNFLILLLVPLFLTSCSEGCGIPGHKIFTQCFYYYTDDMTPTRVIFLGENPPELLVSFSIPKAYIITASPYVRKKTRRDSSGIEAPVLPDEIKVNRLSLWMGAKTGKPLKVTERYGLRQESALSISLDQINPISHYQNEPKGVFGFTLDWACRGKATEKLGEVRGYNMYIQCLGPEKYNRAKNKIYSDVLLYPKNGKDLRHIHCLKNPGGKRKILCRHRLILRDRLRMEVSINSFRLIGNDLEDGLFKAEKQVAFVLDAICPMVGCDSKYKSYYDNLGEN